jgi:hypothetical protein
MNGSQLDVCGINFDTDLVGSSLEEKSLSGLWEERLPETELNVVVKYSKNYTNQCQILNKWMIKSKKKSLKTFFNFMQRKFVLVLWKLSIRLEPIFEKLKLSKLWEKDFVRLKKKLVLYISDQEKRTFDLMIFFLLFYWNEINIKKI